MLYEEDLDIMDNKTRFYLDEVSIRSICKDLLRNWWVILLAAVTVVLGVSAYNSVLYIPEYTASTTFAVSAKGGGNSGNAYASLTTTTEMASVFQDVFQSDVLIKKFRKILEKISWMLLSLLQ